MGPILTFDKSTLHALSVDECVWVGRFYNVNITPIYFAEVIADLEKEVAEGKSQRTSLRVSQSKQRPLNLGRTSIM